MSDEQDKLKASLEPPRIFGRKKKAGSKGAAKPAKASARGKPAKSAEQASEAGDAPDTEAATPEATTPLPEADEATGAEPVDDGASESVADVAPAAATEVTSEPVEDAASAPAEDDSAVADAEETQVIEDEPASEAEATQVIEDEPASEPVGEATDVIETDQVEAAEEGDEADDAPAEPEQDEPAQSSVRSRMADRVRSRWGPKPTPVEEDAPAEPATPAYGQIEVEPEPVSEAEAEAEDADIAARGTAYTEPMLAHYPAAALTGALVGLAMVVLTWLSLRGCEAIRGTATCGGGPGLLLLLAVFIVSVMLGNAILKSFLVPDPGSSSFLAVGLVAVVALLLLIDALDSWVMLIAIPLISIAAYLLSVYVTKTFVEPADDS